MCVLSKDTGTLFGNESLGFDVGAPYGERSSDDSGVDTSAAAKASGTSTTASATGEGSRREECYENSNLSNTGIVGSGNKHELRKAKHGYHAMAGTSDIYPDNQFAD